MEDRREDRDIQQGDGSVVLPDDRRGSDSGGNAPTGGVPQ